ncbi:YccF domain-containing protein [Acetivibrio straminisolvens]|uniref:Integral membrane protein n=1 Tax=Acetivibrio straminisolvens JCM 21531 TaxID=1294263 RepID=W4VCV5_9FIRM|nr:YccF domain-containing protein [Acetivibrio straminisolvens]GAE90628.1 integral membrane protein [Acetivibrio straminisolvens JCM 21531]
MRFIGNIIWMLFGGIFLALGWMLAGLILCITIIGIPFGVQCFKIAGLVLWPFGREVQIGNFGVGGLLFNIIWIIFLGWELALSHFITGLLFCITIIGIPFGLQHFKLAKLGLVPFGARIN